MSIPQMSPAPQLRPQRRILKRILWAAAILLILAMLGTVGLAVYVGWNLTHPKHKPLHTTPAAYGLRYEDITFPSREDHLPLKGWYIPAAGASSDKTVIIAHGYAGNREETGPDALNVAKMLTAAGYNALLFDFRDSGESPGTEVTVGGRETRDLAGAVDFVREQKGARKVALLGYSMGATTSLLTAGQLPEVNAVIEDSAFEALGPFVLENAKHWTHLPDVPFSYVIYAVIPKMLGENLDEVDAMARMPKLADRPVLFIHGTADDAVDQHHAKDLYAAYQKAGGTRGQLWIVPGAKHVQAFKVQPKEYTDRVLAFLQGALQ